MRHAKRPVPGPELITKTNVTPIIDVALVLVIILLVTAPIMSAPSTHVRLPEAHTKVNEGSRGLNVIVEPTGEIRLDDQPIRLAELAGALRGRLASPGAAERRVVVWADAGVPYARVELVLEATRKAGAARIALATQHKQPERP